MNEIDRIEEELRLAMVAVSDYFRSIPERGNQIPMPADDIRKNLAKLMQSIRMHVNDVKTTEVALADDKLKNEYGEDWLTYRDDRLKELRDERDTIYTSVPNGNGRAVDVPAERSQAVDTLPTN